ncbi:unannotated protein [freshwater metagenome]|uniref:Unannotated protein n=1 Tax=freshwater metagenome TaxID=449393 RepID=A0A6J6BXY6_9ZZZZ
MTKTVEGLTTKISDTTEEFLDKNKMAMNAASALIAVSKLKKKSETSKKKSKRTTSDEEFE